MVFVGNDMFAIINFFIFFIGFILYLMLEFYAISLAAIVAFYALFALMIFVFLFIFICKRFLFDGCAQFKTGKSGALSLFGLLLCAGKISAHLGYERYAMLLIVAIALSIIFSVVAVILVREFLSFRNK